MQKYILKNGKYRLTTIKFGRTLHEKLLDIEPGKYRIAMCNVTTNLEVERQYNCIIFILGEFKYYFDLGGEFSMLLKGNTRLNENFDENNKVVEYLMEFLQTPQLERI
ncbi:hypothetical protein CPT_Melin_067 [Acinetobacter phage Melin]|nr:hypothetical protein CPT_Melin_067 [Acinetobacter phage Melin]